MFGSSIGTTDSECLVVYISISIKVIEKLCYFLFAFLDYSLVFNPANADHFQPNYSAPFLKIKWINHVFKISHTLKWLQAEP